MHTLYEKEIWRESVKLKSSINVASVLWFFSVLILHSCACGISRLSESIFFSLFSISCGYRSTVSPNILNLFSRVISFAQLLFSHSFRNLFSLLPLSTSYTNASISHASFEHFYSIPPLPPDTQSFSPFSKSQYTFTSPTHCLPEEEENGFFCEIRLFLGN